MWVCVCVCALHQNLLPSALTLLSENHYKKKLYTFLCGKGWEVAKNTHFSRRPVELCVLSKAFYSSVSAFGKVPSYLS